MYIQAGMPIFALHFCDVSNGARGIGHHEETKLIPNPMQLLFSQIPATCNTVEKIHAWSGLLLHRSNSTLKVLESANYSDYACQNSLFTADDGTERLVIRVNLKLDPEYATGVTKIWTSVLPFADISIPSAFLA